MRPKHFAALISVLGLTAQPLAAHEAPKDAAAGPLVLAQAHTEDNAIARDAAGARCVAQHCQQPDIDVYLSFHEESVAIGPRAVRMPWSAPAFDSN